MGILFNALAFYAREDTYAAIAMLADPPCGELIEDFDKDPRSSYNRDMPGKRARAAIAEVAEKYGDLVYLSKGDTNE